MELDLLIRPGINGFTFFPGSKGMDAAVVCRGRGLLRVGREDAPGATGPSR